MVSVTSPQLQQLLREAKEVFRDDKKKRETQTSTMSTRRRSSRTKTPKSRGLEKVNEPVKYTKSKLRSRSKSLSYQHPPQKPPSRGKYLPSQHHHSDVHPWDKPSSSYYDGLATGKSPSSSSEHASEEIFDEISAHEASLRLGVLHQELDRLKDPKVAEVIDELEERLYQVIRQAFQDNKWPDGAPPEFDKAWTEEEGQPGAEEDIIKVRWLFKLDGDVYTLTLECNTKGQYQYYVEYSRTVKLSVFPVLFRYIQHRNSFKLCIQIMHSNYTNYLFGTGSSPFIWRQTHCGSGRGCDIQWQSEPIGDANID